MACSECGKPICPREMVATPVGYKCPDCARPARSQYTYVKPRQLAGGIGMGLLVGVGGAILLGMTGFGFFLISLLWGALTGEAVRRGSGGHRGPTMSVVAGACVVLGGFLGGLGLLGIIFGVVGVIATLGWGWGR